MWLQAATGWAFGFTEFTARIWSAVSGAGVVGVTFLLGRFLYDGAAATLASVIVATTFQVFVQARLAVFDPTLLVFMLAAFYMFLVAATSGSRATHLWAWTWAGLATLTKGPIGLLLPLLVLGALSLLGRRFVRPWWRETPPLGPILFVVIGLHWYAIEAVRHGAPFLQTVVGYYLVGRFFGVVESQSGPWWFYVPVLLAGAFPWTAFLPATAVYHLRRRREYASQVILLWVGVILGFYTLAGTKLPNYILPVYPLLAIAIARLCVNALQPGSVEARRLLAWAFGLVVAGAAVFVAAVAVFGIDRHPAEVAALRNPLILLAGVLAVGPLAAAGLALARRPGPALVALAGTVVAALPVLTHHTLPAIEAYRPIPRIAQRLRADLRPGDGLVGVRMNTVASLIYYSRHRVVWVEGPVELARALCRYDRVFIVVHDREYAAWVADRLPQGVRQQGADGPYRILLIESRGACVGLLPGEGAGWSPGSS
jgi:4-amino-4-deoxy-L-arabinose transferase-like glycosyltransferase